MHPELIHPDMKAVVESHGGLFDVAGLPGADKLQSDIGRPVRFVNPSCGVEHESGWFIAGIQKNYAGELCYSLYRDGLGMTRCTSTSRVEFI